MKYFITKGLSHDDAIKYAKNAIRNSSWKNIEKIGARSATAIQARSLSKAKDFGGTLKKLIVNNPKALNTKF